MTRLRFSHTRAARGTTRGPSSAVAVRASAFVAGGLAATVLALAAWSAPGDRVNSATANPSSSPEAPATYARLLATHVQGDLVDYATWHRSADDRAALDRVIDDLEALDPTSLHRDAALAYWINLYNAVTLDAVLDGYPVDSIQKLTPPGTPTIWTRSRVTVAGDSLSLDDIEHQRLRARFEEPRIHFALNCASKGCPPLLGEPFVGDKIESQLQAVTRHTLGDPRWVQVLEDGELLRLSPIFEWFAEDFVAAAGSVPAFVARHRPDLDAAKVRQHLPRVEWIAYDWSLNAVPS